MAMRPLHDVLCDILGSPFPDGLDHCYYEPPADIQMKYPCIVYHYSGDYDDFADNMRYRKSKIYMVTVIDEDPDSKIPDKLKDLPYCRPDRNFSTGGLKHFVHTLCYEGPRIKGEYDNG